MEHRLKVEKRDLQVRLAERTLVASPDYKHAPQSTGTETTDELEHYECLLFLVNGSTVISGVTRVREGNLSFARDDWQLPNRAACARQYGTRIRKEQYDRTSHNDEQNHCHDCAVDNILRSLGPESMDEIEHNCSVKQFTLAYNGTDVGLPNSSEVIDFCWM
jgi:hypothetical protein